MTEIMFVNAVCGIMAVFGLVCFIDIIAGMVIEAKSEDKYWN